MTSAREKIEFINTLQGQTITSLSFELVTVNGQILPDWLTTAFSPEFKKSFGDILQKIEKGLRQTAENELVLQVAQAEAVLNQLKQELKDLRRNGGTP